MENTYLTTAQRARAELKEIALKREALDRRTKFLHEVIAYAEGDDQPVAIADKVEKATGPKTTEAAETKTKQAMVSSFCEGYISKVGPTAGADLYKVITDFGIKLTGVTRGAQMINMSGYLNQVGRLRYYREHGRWWFVNQPYPSTPRNHDLLE